jgi:hypothetical protein
VELRQNDNYIRLKDGKFFIDVDELELDNDEVYVNGKKLSLLPQDASSRVKGNVLDIKLEELENKNIYQIKTKTKAKILGIFDIILDKDVQLDAESGEIINQNKPWWSFLTIEEE